MMNYVYDPEVAAKIAAYVNYVTPVVGAKEVLAETDPKLADDPLIFPDEADLDRLQPYFSLSPEEERQVVEEMTRVTGA
jgi:spermidine/putrescine transport system substrate-binding protein